jgi:hypothetical protein
MDAVKWRKLDMFQHELQLCDTIIISFVVEEFGYCVEPLSPVS